MSSTASVIPDSDSKESEFADLIKARVAGLRPKLLDISRRNSLISPRLGPSSNTHVQVVDELPQVLYSNLINQTKMRFRPLPSLNEDPIDESSVEFQDALTQEREEDEDYKKAVNALGQESEEDLESYRVLERSLKDKVRSRLEMCPRQTKNETSLPNHAKNHGISASYELPEVSDTHEDGRHEDKDIQTLLLPDALDRKLGKIASTCNSYTQETGVHVLFAAFGFLEWKDLKSGEKIFAPLVILPVDVIKERTKEGPEFWVVGQEAEGEINPVLQEKLKQDFGINLPGLEERDLETYFRDIAALTPNTVKWNVRRQVVFGVFPSAKIAMFHDLNPANHSFESNSIISDLLAGAASGTGPIFGDEYNIDDPVLEKKVPCVVMDADSSQVSTLVDLMDGKNLAVEGPPGTGKSQTIVNAIAAALNDGKKVLFVAEKAAALNVVKSRLEAVGLGPFVLALQAEKASREQVFASINARLAIGRTPAPRELEQKIERLKEARTKIQQYINILTSAVGSTSLTVFECMGRAIKSNPSLENASEAVMDLEIDKVHEFSQATITKALVYAEAVSKAWPRIADSQSFWSQVDAVDIDKFQADQMCKQLANLISKLDQIEEIRRSLVDLGYSYKPGMPVSDLLSWLKEFTTSDRAVVLHFIGVEQKEECQKFLTQVEYLQKAKDDLQAIGVDFAKLPDEALLAEVIKALGGNKAHKNLAAHLEEDVVTKKRLQGYEDNYKVIERAISTFSQAHEWPLEDFAKFAPTAKKISKKAAKLRARLDFEDIESEDLQSVIGKIETLRKAKTLVDQVFYITRVNKTSDELIDLQTTLRNAGFFSMFDSNFKTAKQFTVSISRRPKFDKLAAVADLDALIEYKREEEKLAKDSSIVSIFDSNFSLDMDLEPYKNLMDFFEEVETAFPNEDQQGQRNLLLARSKDELSVFPVDSFIGAEKLNARQIAALIGSCKDKITEVKELVALATSLQGDSKLLLSDQSQLEKLSDDIRQFKFAQQALDQDENVARYFGDYFRGADTNSKLLGPAISVAAKAAGISAPFADISLTLQGDGHLKLADHIEQILRCEADLLQLSQIFQASSKIDAKLLQDLQCDQAALQQAREAIGDKDALFGHSAFKSAVRDLASLGLGKLVDLFVEERRDFSTLVDTVEAIIYHALSRYVYSNYQLGKYSGTKLDECRSTVAQYDREIISLSRQALQSKLNHTAKPVEGVSQGRKSDFSEMALIRNEIGKKRGHISVRALTERAKASLLELKPCWMMSPLAVARYLQKGESVFDLVIIDEASQMPPENALGALVRGRQAMIVGDTNQLPPSDFFQTGFQDDDLDEDEVVAEASVLEMANSVFRPARRLRWHYRSKHSSLINFSNQMVYDGELVVFPGPCEENSDLGVSLHHVSGLYKTGLNQIEADAMVHAILDFMKNSPEKSLGVVTMNSKQRDLIQERLEHAIAQNYSASSYIDRWIKQKDGLEAFFVKNLENVQGDERDVIFIGTVYGPSEPGGKVLNRFGPINGVTGKRRLNVLFSRAKMRTVTFTSMLPTDISADENGNVGAYMLKKWLEYSGSGGDLGGMITGRGTDSDFEDHVIRQLKSIGCEAVPQVGAAGYFIDIGVKHPDWPYGFILGVECDGAAYHSSKSARDRDRLRQEVLEGLGWRFHRIWSTDWFTDPNRQAEILRDVIAKRLTELKSKIQVSF